MGKSQLSAYTSRRLSVNFAVAYLFPVNAFVLLKIKINYSIYIMDCQYSEILLIGLFESVFFCQICYVFGLGVVILKFTFEVNLGYIINFDNIGVEGFEVDAYIYA